MDSTIAVGASAEHLAADLLQRRGYRIVERNFRCTSGELDIVARDGEILCFIEVRSRTDGEHGQAAETIDKKKQRQVARVALHYIGLRNPSFDRSRFDVVAITGNDAQLIQDAWRL
jgi:putative endonuclease